MWQLNKMEQQIFQILNAFLAANKVTLQAKCN